MRLRLFSRVLSLGFLVLAVLFAALMATIIAARFLASGGTIGLGSQDGWLDTSGHMSAGYTALGDLPFRVKLTYLLWIGALDPHPRAPSAGVARLTTAGVYVAMVAELDHPEADGLTRMAERLVAPFAKLSRTGRPWVLVKTALDAGGGMIPPPGVKTFTSPQSLLEAHRLRRDAEAILTGSGTVLSDDPAFTVRHLPDHPDRRRRLAILDRRGRTPAAYLQGARLRGLDASLYADLGSALDALGAAGVLTALVEAGPTLRRAILDAELWDEEVIFHKAAAADAADSMEVRRRVEPKAPTRLNLHTTSPAPRRRGREDVMTMEIRG